MSKHANEQENNQPIQGFCPKCGRNLELDDIGTDEKPAYVLPIHHVIKGNGSKTVIRCKHSGGKAE